MTIDDIVDALIDLKKKLPIRQNELDNECRRQSWLLEDAGDLEIQVVALLKRKKDQLVRIRAGLYLDIRANPQEFKVGAKPTAPIIEARIEEMRKYSDAQDDLRDVEDLVDSVKSVKSVVDTRRSMLHELVKLYVYNYISGPQDAGVLRDQETRERMAEEKMQRLVHKRIARDKESQNGTEESSSKQDSKSEEDSG